VGTVFQNPRSQFFNVDTTSELAFACENRGMPVDQIKGCLEATVNRFGLADLMGRSIFKLSGKERQKIACGSVDAAHPEAILLDEPSANLDYDATLQLRELIRTWKSLGKTILAAEPTGRWSP
jgi:energy-coupling factor transport system ATP-binding protein